MNNMIPQNQCHPLVNNKNIPYLGNNTMNRSHSSNQRIQCSSNNTYSQWTSSSSNLPSANQVSQVTIPVNFIRVDNNTNYNTNCNPNYDILIVSIPTINLSFA